MTSEQTVISMEAEDEKGTRVFCREALKHLKNAGTILLYGDLGSGKTFLTREFVQALGLEADVSSPSFSIINQYAGDPAVNHIDLYRLGDVREIENLGLDELLNSGAINFIEWPQIIEDQINWPHYRIYIRTDELKETWRGFILNHSDG